MFNRELKERIKLLEDENILLIRKVNALIKFAKTNEYKDPRPIITSCTTMNGLDYNTLRSKYRKYDMIFIDES
jgi:hypothetical protein